MVRKMTQQQPTATWHRQFVLDLLPAGSVGAEIGVHQGDFSQVILDVVSPALLHLIDPWHHEPSPTYEKAWYGGQAEQGQQEMDARYAGVLARFDDAIRTGTVVVHRGASDEVLGGLSDGSLDWVYIDGNHLYEFAATDLALSLAKVRVGGLITGDDYAEGGWWEGGVKRAVDEFAGTAPVRQVEIRNGQYVFERLPG